MKGVCTKRSRTGKPAESMVWRGVPVTTPPRTLVDLAADLDEDELARACHEAGVRFRTTPAQVEAVLARRPRSPGGPKLRRIMRGEIPVTLSRLESRFIRVLREAGLPLPRTNKVASERRVDCRWPEHRLTVELDSYRYHSLPPRLGAGPPQGARGPRSRGRFPALHLRRRLREPAPDARGAVRGAGAWAAGIEIVKTERLVPRSRGRDER